MAEPLPGGVLLPGEQTFQVPELKPMDPKLKAEDPFAGLELADQAAPATDGFAGLEQVQHGDEFASLEQADDLDLKDEKTLFEDDTFRPADYLAQNPKVGGEKLTKLLSVYRERQKRGLETGKVLKAAATEAPGIVVKTVKGARDLVSRAIDFGIQPAANKLIGAVVGTTPEEQAAIDAEQGKTQLKAAGEVTAGTESAITGLANLASTGVRKLLGKSPEKMTENELLDQLYLDAEFSKATKEAAEGTGDAVKASGLDAETLSKNGITLDKEAIEHLSLVDPLTLIATGGAFKVVGLGGRVLATAATKVGAEAALTGLKSLAANTVRVAGKAIEKSSKVAGPLMEKIPAKSVGFALGAAKSGTLQGGAVGAAAGEAAKRIGVESAAALERRGAQLANVGEQLNPNFVGPKSAGLERISTLAASPVGQAVGSAVKGAVQGAATAAPLALAADDSQTAGALLGGGAALGGIHGAVTGGKAAIAETVAKRYLDPHQIPFDQTNSPAYGTDVALDSAHEKAIQQLPSVDQNMVNTFREAVRTQGGEIYVQDGAEYLNRIREALQRENGGSSLTPEQEAAANLYAKTHAFFDSNVGGKRTVFLNSTAKGLPHDAGHLFQSLLDSGVQSDLRKTVLGSYSPEQLNAFKQAYAKKLGEPDFFVKLGEEAGNAKAADELIAENFSQLFQNNQFKDLKAPTTLLQKLAQVALNSSEALGIDLKAGRTTPDLAASPSYRLQGILRNAAQEILTRAPEAPKPEDVTPASPIEPPKAAEVRPAAETPAAPITPNEVKPAAPRAPEQPATDAPNIRTTREQQNDFSSRRADETGVAEAQKLSEGDPETRAIVDQIAPHFEKGTVLEIEHRGIASERRAPSPEGRTSRRATQAQGYEELARLQVENRKNAPADIVNEHQKTFVPVRFTSQGGKPTLIAMSLDKVIANVHRVVSDAAAKGVETLIPYPTEAGKLTEAGWRQAVTDIKSYAENQSNGYRGDGQKLVRPTEDIGVSLPAENPNYTPKPLTEAAMNFANLVQGLNPPETGRVQKGVTPGNVKGQLLAEVNRKQPMKPSVIKPENVQKQGFKGFEPREVAETNPLRNELAARGVKVRELIEVTERINAEDIASAKPRPDIEFKAPVTDTIRAGFLPDSKKVIDAEVTRRLEEKRKNGVPVTDAERSKTRKEVEFDQRNGRLGQERRGALMFLPGEETDKAVRSGFIPDTNPSERTPSAEIRSMAERYTKSAGIDYRPSRDYAPLKPELGREIADFYEAAKSNVDDPAVQSSYQALSREVLSQYKAMVDAGYTIEPWKGEGEPYKSSADAVGDIRNNKHLYFLKTDGNFGSGPDVHSTNPMLNDSGVVAGGDRLMVNDVFRAVHDFFGHGKEGNQFGPRGEFNAWRSHSEMFSPEAQGALAAETLAQNSWVNFGKHLRNADGSIPAKGEAGYIPPQNRPFADQKNIIIPPELIEKARAAATDRSFLPDGQSVEEFGRKLLEVPAAGFKPAMDALGGLTNGAWDLGMKLTDPRDVQVLKNLAEKAGVKAKELMASGDFSEAMPAVMKGQFFREAYEAATGTASVKTAMENGRMPAGYKPPFPETESPKFLPEGQSVEEFGRKMMDVPPENFQSELDKIGGLTRGAWDLGMKLTRREDLPVLQRLAEEASTKGREAMAAKDFDSAMPFIMKGQFFREAYESATGTGSVKTAITNGMMPEGYKPPFPEGETAIGGKGETERLFLPASEVPAGVDAIDKAAIRTDDGQVFTGSWHGEAYDNLAQAVAQGTFKGKFPEGFKSLTDLLENPADAAQAYIEDGFVTKSGKFLNRVEALDHAQQIKQLKPGAEKDLGRYSRMEAGILESDEFKGTRQFLPQTESGKTLAKDGYDFRVSGGLGNRSVTVLKDGVAVGEILSSQRKPKVAEVASVHLDKRDRGAGVGEALYRELFQQLKDDGVELVGGTVVAPQPLAIRNKIFGGFDSLEVGGEPATLPEALSAADVISRGQSFKAPGVDAVNRIGPNQQFLPSKEPRAVKDAAFQDPDTGDIYAGRYHIAAFGEARKAGLSESSLEKLVDGFVTNDGEFLTREQAFGRAIEMEQMSAKDYEAQIKAYQDEELPVASSEKSLETTLFNDVRKGQRTQAFLPKERTDDQGRPLTTDGLVDYEKLYKRLTAQRAEKDKADLANVSSKYSVPEEAQPAGDKPTGWITPKGDYVPLDTEFHEQFLANNRAKLNEEFGTDFSEKSNVADRLKAINKGFVRIRQTPNGELIVELNQKFWKDPTKSAVQDTVIGRAENLDKLRVSLLDDGGQVVDTSTARLFDAEDPVAAATKALGSLKASDVVSKRSGPTKIQQAREFGEPAGGSEPKFLPKGGTPEFNDYVDARIKDSRKFPEALPLEFVKDEAGNYKTAYGDEPLPVSKSYDLLDTYLGKKQKGKTVAEREEKLSDVLSESLQRDYQEAKKNPEIEAGEKWYSTFRDKIQGLLGDDTKLFAELLGATSPQTSVDVNFGYSLDAYNRFKSGEYDAMLAKYREGKNAFKAGELEEFSKETGKTGKKATENAFLDWWIEKHNLVPTSSKGRKFGFHSKSVLRVLDGSWLQNVKGPKTPNFTGNLTGSTFEATIDVWAMRALHRMANEGNKGRWRIQIANETGVADQDFFLGQKAFRKAADKLGILPDALQAILWFAEKERWEKNGWTRAAGTKKSDFNVLMEDTQRTPEGLLERVSKRPEPELDFGPKMDDVKLKK